MLTKSEKEAVYSRLPKNMKKEIESFDPIMTQLASLSGSDLFKVLPPKKDFSGIEKVKKIHVQ